MKAWLSLVSVGMFASLVVTSCVITDDDPDDDDETGGEAGETSTGGRSTGGRASGGSSTGGKATGGSSTGGSTGTGGNQATGGGGEGGGSDEPTSCTENTTPADTCEFGGDTQCEACLAAECCDEVKACYGSDPDDFCGWPAGESDFECVKLCLASVYALGDYPSEADVGECIDECDTCKRSYNMMIGNATTGGITSCMNDNCEVCYEEALQ